MTYVAKKWIYVPKNWCFLIVVLHKTLGSPLDCKEIKSVNPKGNSPWRFTERTDAEIEAQIIWLPDARNQLIGKVSDSGKNWGQEEKGVTEDEMVEWNHWLNEHEFEQSWGGSERQGSLECCSPWGPKRVRHNLVAKQEQHTIWGLCFYFPAMHSVCHDDFEN